MTITNGYCTLAEAKARLWPTGAPADTSEDTLLEDIVMAASRQIDEDTSRRFFTTASDETRTYAARWFDCLPCLDIISVTTLKTDEDGDGTYEITWTTGDFQLAPYNASLDGKPYTEIHLKPEGDYSFPVGDYPGVQIVGKFGYASTAPKNIKEACLIQVLIDYQTKNLVGGMGKLNADLEVLKKDYREKIQPFVRIV